MGKTISLLGAGILALATLIRAQDDKPPQNYAEKWGNGKPNELDFGTNGGLNAVASTTYTKTQWPWGMIPKNCEDVMVTGKEQFCNPYDIEVYEIKYSDCPDKLPHYVCRCHDAQLDIDVFAKQFGRLPAKAREWNRDIFLAGAKNNQCSAWANGADLWFLGPCGENHSLFIHETTHNLDLRLIPVNGSRYSSSQDWKNKVFQGSCVTDSYAKQSWAECFAQVGVLAAYNANVQSVWNLDIGCMADQVGRTIELLDGALRRTGAQCSRVWGKAAKVCMGPAARDSGNCPGLRQLEPAVIPALSPEAQAEVDARQLESLIASGWAKAEMFKA